MAEWQRQEYRLKADHGWKAPPGHKIFVANAGAVLFNYPAEWVVIPTDDAIEFHDRQPPADDCVLKVSVIQLAAALDLSALPPLSYLLDEMTGGDTRGITSRDPVVTVQRKDLELAWYEARFTDPVERREACSRACLARRKNVMVFLTMDFWPEHVDKFGQVWDEVLRSLQMARHIANPLQGPSPRRGPDRRRN